MLIKNGFLIDPATKKSGNYDIRIKNGIITEIGNTLSPAPNEQVTDAAGLTVAPGLIDTHIHFRDPGFTYKENIHTGSQAAAAGGFTSVICMANTSPVVDNTETLTDILERAKDEKIHVYQAASVSHKLRGEEMTDMEALKTAGACGFTDDGIPLKNAAFLYEAMEKSKQLNVPISLHEEDPSFIKNNGVNHGAVSEQLGIYGSPSIAEESLVARDCMIALHSGADVVMQHISSGRSVDIIRHFKSLGANIHTEATPHHFTLTDERYYRNRPCPAQQRRKRTLHHCRSKRNHRFGNITGARDHFSCTQRASVTYAASRKNDDQSRQTVSFRRRKNRKGRSCRPRDLRSRSKMDS